MTAALRVCTALQARRLFAMEPDSMAAVTSRRLPQVPAHPMPAQPPRARPFPFGRASSKPPPSPGHIPRAKHAPAPSHAARCRCPLLVHAPRYPPLTFGRTWRAKREASHNDPGRYRHLLFELRMLVLFDACGYAYVWSGCAERVLHAHVAVDRLPHFRLLRPISLGGRKCGDTFVMHKHIV